MVAVHKKYWLCVVALVWSLALSVGFWKLTLYGVTPGLAAQSKSRWPAHTDLQRTLQAPALVAFVHPRCPCSAATLSELERLMPSLYRRFAVTVVFFKPKGETDAWAQQALWRKARAIPGVETRIDEAGVEATRFGAQTSGQVFLFDQQGALVFEGGITPERGHSGDSVGRSAILHFVQHGTSEIAHAPVFGCALIEDLQPFADISKETKP